MKDGFATQTARAVVARQLKRREIGNTQQRAMLVGIMTALQWVDEIGDMDRNCLQQMLDGRPVLPNNETLAEAHARQQVKEATKARKNKSFLFQPEGSL